MGKRGRLGFVLAICSLTILPPTTAGAAPVTNINDGGPGSLRQAILDAAPGETVSVPAGTYMLSSGPLEIAKSLTVAGAGASSTAISSSAPQKILALSGAASQITISGFTIRDARAAGNVVQGGVIAGNPAGLSLSGVVIANTVVNATIPGSNGGVVQGGVINFAGERLSIVDSRIVDTNIAAGGDSGKAGGVVQGGVIDAPVGSFAIERSTIAGTHVDVRGGQGPSSAGQNGGVVQGGALDIVAESGESVIGSSTISGNVANASGGPGGSGGVVQGGAVDLLADQPVAIVESTVAANQGLTGGTGIVAGGGMTLLPSPPGSITFTSSTVVGNVAEGSAFSSGGNLNFVAAPVKFANSIVAGGVGPIGTENCGPVGATSATSLGFNLDSRDQCGFHSPGDKVNADPQLGPLQDNGGPTQTMLPAATSPVVDQGAGFGLTSDQRGVVRPIDFPSIPNSAAPGANGSDIGAVELQPSNAFSLGKLKKNKKKGTALLTVNLPSPNVGSLSLSGKGLKPRTATVDGSKSTYTFKVTTKGGARKALRHHGKRKVAISVTYAPLGNSPATVTRKAKLVLKHKHKRRKAHRH